MTTETLVIGVIRVLGALPVLRWALAGALLALVVDQSDLLFRNILDLGGLPNYQRFDKIADQVYLLTFLWVALRWRHPARTIAVGLYAFRLIGFAAFEASNERAVLLFFPNLFEFWFLFVAAVQHWRPDFDFRARSMAAPLTAMLSLKEFQEYALHWGKWLDGFSTVEALEAIWDFVTAPFR